MTLITILAMALVTYATRFAGLVLIRDEPPGALARWLHHVPIALFAAIVVPGVLAPRGPIEGGKNALAAAAALAVALRTRRPLIILAVGMAAFWLLSALGVG